MSILPEIIQRRSVRNFKPELVDNEQITELLQAAQLAPTSRNDQATEFITVTNPDIKQKIHGVTENKQAFVQEAPLLIIPVTNPDKTSNAIQDLSLASAHIFLQAEKLGLGAVWKNIRETPATAIKKILGVPASYLLINIIPLGYPAAKPDPHETTLDTSRVHTEKY